MDTSRARIPSSSSSPTKLIAARDPHGFRPLCMGMKDGVACLCLEAVRWTPSVRSLCVTLRPGEIVVVDKTAFAPTRATAAKRRTTLCVFEFIYFARPDSVIDGSSVHSRAPAGGRVSGARASRAGGCRHRRAGFRA